MAHPKINENDLDKLFAGSKRNSHSILSAINYILIFLSIFFVVFTVINFNAIRTIISFWYSNEIKLDNATDKSPYKNAVVSIRSGSNTVITEEKLPNISDNHIFIPSTNIDAPIVWRVSDNESAVQSALQNGVIHIAGTALPGEIGNVFITGHSSNYFWARGNYKNIFALLNRLVVGDLIYIKYQDNVFVYKTISSKVVKPNDLSVIESTNTPTLTLMTCSPVGTSLYRLIVKAEQIVPTFSTTRSSTTESPNSLPSGVR